MKLLTYILFLLCILLGLTFACLNAEPVSINYYVGTRTLPLALLLVIAFGIGCLVGILLSGATYLRLKAKNMRLQTRLNMAEKELVNLRTIPVKDSH